jgi:hypothetical protein
VIVSNKNSSLFLFGTFKYIACELGFEFDEEVQSTIVIEVRLNLFKEEEEVPNSPQIAPPTPPLASQLSNRQSFTTTEAFVSEPLITLRMQPSKHIIKIKQK